MIKITDEIRNLFQMARTACGGDVTSTELSDKQLCDNLEMAIGDYAQKVQMEIIGNQYAGLLGKNLSNPMELAYSFAVRSLDLSKQYSYWFSKEVGLQQEGPWELKKDFIKIEQGKQVYVIPSGRTINKVMYVNPPTTDLAIMTNYVGSGVGFMPGLGQIGGAGYAYGAGLGGFYTTQASDIAYLASDYKFKQSLFVSDFTYKVTAGPNGTHLLHLMSTPGSKLSFGFSGVNRYGYGLVGCEVWYTYYDTSNGGEDECIRAHMDDVILSPYQVPLAQIDYAFLNEPAKVTVRQLFVGKVKQTLGNIRGKFSGKISIPQAELTMDYQMLIQQGKEEYEQAMQFLKEQLERMRPVNIMKEQADLMESNMRLKGYTPLPIIRI